MLKRILSLLLVLLLPFTALAELEYITQEKKFIDFPSLDGWRGHFASVKNWTIVTPESLDENLDLVLQRGDSEAEIRARYAGEHFLFEAYSTDLFTDACFRAEVYENDFTRDVWHLRHVGGEDRTKLVERLESGEILPDREVYFLRGEGSNAGARLNGYFTNFPKDANGNVQRHESGMIQFSFYNGRMYVFSYCVSGRQAGRSRWYSSKEEVGTNKLPMGHSESAFRDKMLPRLPKYTLDEAIPELIAPGDLTVSGTIEKGSAITATLDGQPIDVSLSKQTNFTLVASLTEVGTHALEITVENKKFTTRVMPYTIEVSADVTPLQILEVPERVVTNGELAIRGKTDPGAQVIIDLDELEPVTVTADDGGLFTHTMTIEDAAVHQVQITAVSGEKQANGYTSVFQTEYKTVNDGIAAFSEDLEEIDLRDIIADPAAYEGKKVKMSVQISDVQLNDEGLGLICNWQKNHYERWDDRYYEEPKYRIYVTVPGYAQCQLYENMTISVYGVVDGEATFVHRDEEETAVNILMDYGTYLTYKKTK